jgi:ankyrin repeat protein
MIKCFIDFGIDINCMDYDDRTALHLAVSHKIPSVVKILVQLGADKDI